jgi:hypothetical protein
VVGFIDENRSASGDEPWHYFDGLWAAAEPDRESINKRINKSLSFQDAEFW